jgi:hypothetical protein
MTAATENGQMPVPKTTALLEPCTAATFARAFVNNASFYDAIKINTPLPDLNFPVFGDWLQHH